MTSAAFSLSRSTLFLSSEFSSFSEEMAAFASAVTWAISVSFFLTIAACSARLIELEEIPFYFFNDKIWPKNWQTR